MPLLRDVEDCLYYRSFHDNFHDFASDRGRAVQCLPTVRAWLVQLSDGTLLHLYEEQITHVEQQGCDQCRIIGWGNHPVSSKRYHVIVPAEEGTDSLKDPAALVAHVEARYHAAQDGATAAAPTPGAAAGAVVPIASPAVGPSSGNGAELGAGQLGPGSEEAVPDAAACFESTRHRLHGVVHANGYSHLLRVNGREGGSRSLTGYQLTKLWDALCTLLRVRAVTTEDVSNKAGLELRVLHTAAHKVTWYGRFGYSLGRGAYNITRQQWRRAAEHVHGASLDALIWDFLGGVDDGVLAILQRYRVSPPPGTPATLGGFLQRMLHLLSHPEEAVPLYQLPAPQQAQQQGLLLGEGGQPPAKRPREEDREGEGGALTLAQVVAASQQLLESLGPPEAPTQRPTSEAPAQAATQAPLASVGGLAMPTGEQRQGAGRGGFLPQQEGREASAAAAQLEVQALAPHEAPAPPAPSADAVLQGQPLAPASLAPTPAAGQPQQQAEAPTGLPAAAVGGGGVLDEAVAGQGVGAALPPAELGLLVGPGMQADLGTSAVLPGPALVKQEGGGEQPEQQGQQQPRPEAASMSEEGQAGGLGEGGAGCFTEAAVPLAAVEPRAGSAQEQSGEQGTQQGQQQGAVAEHMLVDSGGISAPAALSGSVEPQHQQEEQEQQQQQWPQLDAAAPSQESAPLQAAPAPAKRPTSEEGGAPIDHLQQLLLPLPGSPSAAALATLPEGELGGAAAAPAAEDAATAPQHAAAGPAELDQAPPAVPALPAADQQPAPAQVGLVPGAVPGSSGSSGVTDAILQQPSMPSLPGPAGAAAAALVAEDAAVRQTDQPMSLLAVQHEHHDQLPGLPVAEAGSQPQQLTAGAAAGDPQQAKQQQQPPGELLLGGIADLHNPAEPATMPGEALAAPGGIYAAEAQGLAAPPLPAESDPAAAPPAEHGSAPEAALQLDAARLAEIARLRAEGPVSGTFRHGKGQKGKRAAPQPASAPDSAGGGSNSSKRPAKRAKQSGGTSSPATAAAAAAPAPAAVRVSGADGRGGGQGGSTSGGRSLRVRGSAEGGGPSSATAQQGQQADGSGMQGPAPPKKYGHEAVGKRVRVYWKEQRTYYSGVVLAFDSKNRKHHIRYHDGDEEHLDLSKEKLHWLDPLSPTKAAAPASPAGPSAASPPAAAVSPRSTKAARSSDKAQQQQQQQGRGRDAAGSATAAVSPRAGRRHEQQHVPGKALEPRPEPKRSGKKNQPADIEAGMQQQEKEPQLEQKQEAEEPPQQESQQGEQQQDEKQPQQPGKRRSGKKQQAENRQGKAPRQMKEGAIQGDTAAGPSSATAMAPVAAMPGDDTEQQPPVAEAAQEEGHPEPTKQEVVLSSASKQQQEQQQGQKAAKASDPGPVSDAAVAPPLAGSAEMPGSTRTAKHSPKKEKALTAAQKRRQQHQQQALARGEAGPESTLAATETAAKDAGQQEEEVEEGPPEAAVEAAEPRHTEQPLQEVEQATEQPQERREEAQQPTAAAQPGAEAGDVAPAPGEQVAAEPATGPTAAAVGAQADEPVASGEAVAGAQPAAGAAQAGEVAAVPAAAVQAGSAAAPGTAAAEAETTAAAAPAAAVAAVAAAPEEGEVPASQEAPTPVSDAAAQAGPPSVGQAEQAVPAAEEPALQEAAAASGVHKEEAEAPAAAEAAQPPEPAEAADQAAAEAGPGPDSEAAAAAGAGPAAAEGGAAALLEGGDAAAPTAGAAGLVVPPGTAEAVNGTLGCPSCRGTACSRCRKKAVHELESRGLGKLAQGLGCEACHFREMGCAKCWQSIFDALGLPARPKAPPRDDRRKSQKVSPQQKQKQQKQQKQQPAGEAKAMPASTKAVRKRTSAAAEAAPAAAAAAGEPTGAAAHETAAGASPGLTPQQGAEGKVTDPSMPVAEAAEAAAPAAVSKLEQQQAGEGAAAGHPSSRPRRAAAAAAARMLAAPEDASPMSSPARPAAPAAAGAPAAAVAAQAAAGHAPADVEAARAAVATGAVAVPSLGCGRCRQAPLGCRDCRKRALRLLNQEGGEEAKAVAALIGCTECSFKPEGCIKCWKALYEALGLAVPVGQPTPRDKSKPAGTPASGSGPKPSTKKKAAAAGAAAPSAHAAVAKAAAAAGEPPLEQRQQQPGHEGQLEPQAVLARQQQQQPADLRQRPAWPEDASRRKSSRPRQRNVRYMSGSDSEGKASPAGGEETLAVRETAATGAPGKKTQLLGLSRAGSRASAAGGVPGGHPAEAGAAAAAAAGAVGPGRVDDGSVVGAAPSVLKARRADKSAKKNQQHPQQQQQHDSQLAAEPAGLARQASMGGAAAPAAGPAPAGAPHHQHQDQHPSQEHSQAAQQGLSLSTAPTVPLSASALPPLAPSPSVPSLEAAATSADGFKTAGRRERKPTQHYRDVTPTYSAGQPASSGAPAAGAPAAAAGPVPVPSPGIGSPTLLAHNAANTWGDCGDGWCGRAMLPYMITRRTVPVASRVLHSLLGRVPSGGEYVTMRDPATNRSMRIEIKHVATANVYYVAGPDFTEWLSSSGMLPGEQLQFKAAGGEVLMRRGPMVPEELLARPPSARSKKRKQEEQLPMRHGPEVVGLRVRLFWPQDQQWYPARITAYQDGKHTVVYDSNETEDLDLAAISLEWVDEPPAPTLPASRPKKPRRPPGASPASGLPLSWQAQAGGADWGAGAEAASSARSVRPIRLKVRRPQEPPEAAGVGLEEDYGGGPLLGGSPTVADAAGAGAGSWGPAGSAWPPAAPGNRVSPDTLPPNTLPRNPAALRPFALLPIPADWQLDRTIEAVRQLLAILKGFAGMWVSRGKVRAMAQDAGLRDVHLLDYAARVLDHVVLDGWAVYRVQHRSHKALYFYAEQVGDEALSDIAPPERRPAASKRVRGGKASLVEQADEGASPRAPTAAAAAAVRGKGAMLKRILLRVPPSKGLAAGGTPPPEGDAAAQAHPGVGGKRPRQPAAPTIPPASELRLPPAGVLAAAPGDAGAVAQQPPWAMLQPGGVPPPHLPRPRQGLPSLAPPPPPQQQQQDGDMAAAGPAPPPAAQDASKIDEVSRGAGDHGAACAAIAPVLESQPPPPPPQQQQQQQSSQQEHVGNQQPEALLQQPLLLPQHKPEQAAAEQQVVPQRVSVFSAQQQVLCDLVYLFHLVLKVYKPMLAMDAAIAAADAAASARAAGMLGASAAQPGAEGGAAAGAPALEAPRKQNGAYNIRQPRLRKLPDEVQVLRDCKHFWKEYPGDRPLEGPQPPPGALRIWCRVQLPQHLALQQAQPSKYSGRKPRMVAAPPELIVLPPGATLGDLRRAAARAYRTIYQAFAEFQVTGVVGGLKRAVRFAPPPALPAPPAQQHGPTAATNGRLEDASAALAAPAPPQLAQPPQQAQQQASAAPPPAFDFAWQFQQGAMALHLAQQAQQPPAAPAVPVEPVTSGPLSAFQQGAVAAHLQLQHAQHAPQHTGQTLAALPVADLGGPAAAVPAAAPWLEPPLAGPGPAGSNPAVPVPDGMASQALDQAQQQQQQQRAQEQLEAAVGHPPPASSQVQQGGAPTAPGQQDLEALLGGSDLAAPAPAPAPPPQAPAGAASNMEASPAGLPENALALTEAPMEPSAVGLPAGGPAQVSLAGASTLPSQHGAQQPQEEAQEAAQELWQEQGSVEALQLVEAAEQLPAAEGATVPPPAAQAAAALEPGLAAASPMMLDSTAAAEEAAVKGMTAPAASDYGAVAAEAEPQELEPNAGGDSVQLAIAEVAGGQRARQQAEAPGAMETSPPPGDVLEPQQQQQRQQGQEGQDGGAAGVAAADRVMAAADGASGTLNPTTAPSSSAAEPQTGAAVPPLAEDFAAAAGRSLKPGSRLASAPAMRGAGREGAPAVAGEASGVKGMEVDPPAAAAVALTGLDGRGSDLDTSAPAVMSHMEEQPALEVAHSGAVHAVGLTQQQQQQQEEAAAGQVPGLPLTASEPGSVAPPAAGAAAGPGANGSGSAGTALQPSPGAGAEDGQDDSGLLLAELLPAAVVGSQAAAAAAAVPTLVVVGTGVDPEPCWLHAGGIEDWLVACSCGTKDDDGERMIACDVCQTWMHTRCQHIPDEAPVPDVFICLMCTKRGKRQHY
ncbi:hypothetical protein N2152v2_007390 [Parachlorella kessleri]